MGNWQTFIFQAGGDRTTISNRHEYIEFIDKHGFNFGEIANWIQTDRVGEVPVFADRFDSENSRNVLLFRTFCLYNRMNYLSEIEFPDEPPDFID